MSERKKAQRGEPRLPMALAIISVGVLYMFIPSDFRISTSATIGYPVELLILLTLLVIGDPGRIDREVPWLRVVTTIMLCTITLATTVAVVRLVIGILQKAAFTSPTQLLTLGAIIWITNVIQFALWYWHLDSGGPAARVLGLAKTEPAFHFPEQGMPEIKGAGWYPQFIDYFALSFNTGTAFSSTDVAAIRHWAKLMMICESAISLTLVALVVARAINIL
jgi:uncharacterized membrane protein